MTRQFRRIGQKPFDGRAGTSLWGVYEWRPRNPDKHGAFNVRFLSPDGEPGPRHYFVEPVLNDWLRNKNSRFLERACAFGYKILVDLEGHSSVEREAYRLFSAVFRNRIEGHTSVGHQFKSVADFLDRSDDRPSLITPGLISRGNLHAFNEPVGPVARLVLRQAFSKQGHLAADLKPGFDGVLKFYERAIEHPAHAKRAETCESLGIVSELDCLLLDGFSPGLDYKCVQEHVRSALIHGPVSRNDFADVESDRDRFAGMLMTVYRVVRRGKQADFDKWLRRIREHGHLARVQEALMTYWRLSYRLSDEE